MALYSPGAGYYGGGAGALEDFFSPFFQGQGRSSRAAKAQHRKSPLCCALLRATLAP